MSSLGRIIAATASAIRNSSSFFYAAADDDPTLRPFLINPLEVDLPKSRLSLFAYNGSVASLTKGIFFRLVDPTECLRESTSREVIPKAAIMPCEVGVIGLLGAGDRELRKN